METAQDFTAIPKAPTPPEQLATRDLTEDCEEARASSDSEQPTTHHRLLQPASSSGGDEAELRSLVDTDEDLVSLLERLQDHHWRLHSADVKICLRPDGSDDVLSQGSSGKVYRGILNGSLMVAIKTLRHSSPASRVAFVEEIVCLMNLRHANILPFYGAIMEGHMLMLITELAPRGSLFDVLANDRDRRLAWTHRGRRIALDVARGISYMHSKGALHSDLKSKNVLLMRDWQAKLCDMGLCGLARTKGEESPGTLEYTAPEVLCGDCSPANQSADIYSFGVILWEIVSGKQPDDRCFDVRVPDDCPQNIADLIRACTSEDPGARPSAAAIFTTLSEHPAPPTRSSLEGTDWKTGDEQAV